RIKGPINVIMATAGVVVAGNNRVVERDRIGSADGVDFNTAARSTSRTVVGHSDVGEERGWAGIVGVQLDSSTVATRRSIVGERRIDECARSVTYLNAAAVRRRVVIDGRSCHGNRATVGPDPSNGADARIVINCAIDNL